MNAPRPAFQVTVNARDVTADLTPYVISVGYTDRVAGASDEAEIVLNNSDQRFTKDWYFSKGDSFQLSLGYGTDLVPCGDFTIDQIEGSGPPDTVTVRALAAGTNSPLRTKRSAAHQDKTIAEIAKTVADAHGFTIEDGTATSTRIKQDFTTERADLATTAAAIRRALATLDVQAAVSDALALYGPTIAAADRLTAKGRSQDAAEIRQTAALWRAAWLAKSFPDREKTIAAVTDAANALDRIIASLVDVDRTETRSKLDIRTAWHTQDQETDLAYLKRVSEAYGVLFSVRGTVLVFTSIYDVEGAEVADTIRRQDVASYSFSDKAVKNYAGVRVIWHNPETAEAVVSEIAATSPDGQPRSGDTLEVRARAETQAQADEIGKSMLHRHTSNELGMDLTLEGRPLLCAGANTTLEGFGVLDGKWAIVESAHRIDVGSGYVTSLKLKRGR